MSASRWAAHRKSLSYVAPVLVLLSYVAGPTPMTLQFWPGAVVMILISTVAMTLVTIAATRHGSSAPCCYWFIYFRDDAVPAAAGRAMNARSFRPLFRCIVLCPTNATSTMMISDSESGGQSVDQPFLPVEIVHMLIAGLSLPQRYDYQ